MGDVNQTAMATPGPTRAWLPNSLTAVRLALGLAYLALPTPWRLPAIGVACVTEFLDGFLARRLHATSLFGQVLDPIADKVFVLAVLISLIRDGVITWPVATGIAARDLAVLVGSLTVGLSRGRTRILLMRPHIAGKLATTAQLLVLLAGVGWGRVPTLLLVLAVVLSVAAAIDYVRRFL